MINDRALQYRLANSTVYSTGESGIDVMIKFRVRVKKKLSTSQVSHRKAAAVGSRVVSIECIDDPESQCRSSCEREDESTLTKL